MPSNPNQPSSPNQVQDPNNVAPNPWGSFDNFEGQTDINAETGEKRDAENQANLERTGRPLMQERGEKAKNAAESQRRPLNDLTTEEIFNLDHSELKSYDIRELLEVQDRLCHEREQIAREETEQTSTGEAGQNATEKNDNIDPNKFLNMSDEEIDNLDLSSAELTEVIKVLEAKHRAVIAKLEAKLANNPDGSKEGQTGIDGVNTVEPDDELDDGPDDEPDDELDGEKDTSGLDKMVSDEQENLTESDIDETVKTPEYISPEDAAKTCEKAKKNSRVRNFLTRKILPIVLVAAIGIPGVGVGISQYLNPNSAAAATTTETATNQSTDDEGANEEYGIYDGYNETGMWNSENKANPLNFANAAEVAPLFDNDECDMVKYAARNQVECMADYMANFPEALQPEGFKGLSILETEQKLQSLSDEEFEAVQAQFEQTVDEAFTRRTTANGEQQNAYMRLIDSNKPATHDNIELVECTTNESNLEVTEFYWVDDDGNEIGSMTMKLTPVRDESNHIISFDGCMQIINPIGSKAQLYSGMETTPENPTNPGTPDVPDTPDRSKGENTHAGEDQQSMGTTENTKGDAEREATADNNASNSNPGSEVDEVITDTTETNADHSGATRADNANTVEQETVDTSNQRGGGDNVDRSQEDLAKIVNGGGVQKGAK